MDKNKYISLTAGDDIEPVLIHLDIWESLDRLVEKSGKGLDDVLDWLLSQADDLEPPNLNA